MENEAHAEPAPFPCAGLVRRARRIADMSQREMARAAGISQATVNRIERGSLVPSMEVLMRIFDVADLALAVVDAKGEVVLPMVDWADACDGAERRYPSHLDTIIDPQPGEWWGDQYGLVRPPETFYRDRALRDQQRRRSQWEARPAEYRNVPPPPMPRGYWERQS
jgi:transcriptional regulator with XRE-family HTH domain